MQVPGGVADSLLTWRVWKSALPTWAKENKRRVCNHCGFVGNGVAASAADFVIILIIVIVGCYFIRFI